MSPAHLVPLPLIACAAILFVGGVFLLLQAVERREKLRLRINNALTSGPEGTVEPHQSKAHLLDLLAKFGASLARSGILSDTTRSQLQQTVNQAGLRGSRVFGIFVGSKVLLMLGLPAATYVFLNGQNYSTSTFYLILGAAFAAGMLFPDFFIKQLRGKHLKSLERGLPDALDMMVICAQAGLGLENAIERVAQEFAFANRAVSLELSICSSEMRIGTDRRTALMALGDRTGLEQMRRLAGTMIQTMQFGTPLSQALRVLAAEMRQDNLTKFEEKAARLPVFLTIPMICFILPCVFIVVGGPAGLQIVKTLGH